MDNTLHVMLLLMSSTFGPVLLIWVLLCGSALQPDKGSVWIPIETTQRRALHIVDSTTIRGRTQHHGLILPSQRIPRQKIFSPSNAHPASHYFPYPEILVLPLDCVLHWYTLKRYPSYIMDYSNQKKFTPPFLPFIRLFVRIALYCILLYFVVFNCRVCADFWNLAALQ